jgi:type I restriction-modification system DNA methylase subunit
MKKSLEFIRETVQILDSISYDNYSDEKTKSYLEYMEGSRADEDRLISPILLRKFLEAILGFELGKSIATQESKGIGKPDYVPVDTRTHPFVFDAKGTDTQYLSQHYPQIKKYISSYGLKYGILTNMRDLDVYTLEEAIEIYEYNFNFVKLYQDYKQNPKTCLEEENTRCFLNFVEKFCYTPLTKEEKIERIAKAKAWSGKEELNAKSLTDQLRHIVNILHNDIKQEKSELLSMAEVGKVSAESIAYEIENISSQISGREIRDVDSEAFNQIMSAGEETSYGKGRDAFFRRVAYFAMTRLLLARVWEDIGFIEQSLYNGGFAKWYENFNHEIRRVLHYAFDLSADRYPWLFNVNNNYSWYEPSDDALIDSLYELSNFYLGKLDQDILGTIYEDYIEKVDKKNKGQYYTPREIVSLIWNRVGYTNSKAFFWHIEGKRVPRFILDPAVGSGGFLVEAARRIRECADFDWNDIQDLQDIHQAILWCIFGSEISSFPYYLIQVNLLIQLTRVIRRILELGGMQPRKKPTPLGIVCRDSMELHNEEPQLFRQEVKEKKEEYQHEIIHFTIAEEKIYEKIKDKYAGKFSYVCANPPYVGEKGHKELFRQTLKLYPYWKDYYQGKMDYLHWFIILGLSKLRELGKLGFITSAYWPTADGASKLRNYILENAMINEMIFFEEVKIFEHAKGQHSLVFVLTKCSGKEHKEQRENNVVKIVRVKCKNQDLEGKTIRENLDFLTKHIQKYINRPIYEDKFIKTFWSGVKQGELPKDGGAWNEIFIDRAFRKIVSKIEQKSIPLCETLDIKQGIVPGVDRVTAQNIRILPRHLIDKRGIKLGDGVFVLTHDEANQIVSNPDKHELLVPSYRNSHISAYYVDIPSRERDYLIYIDSEIDLDKYSEIKSHLGKYREILEARLTRYEEKGYKELYPYYRLNRPRDRGMLSQEKIVVSNWGTDWQPFAYQTGSFFEKRDVTIFVKRQGIKESLLYFLGILNSVLVKYWMESKAKQVGYMRQKLQERIPIYRIGFVNSEEVKAHDEIVEKVKSIRQKMAELADYSKYFQSPRLTRLPFETPLPELDDEAIVKDMSSENLYSLRTHPVIKIEKPKGFEEQKFYLSKVEKPELILTGNAQLELTGKDRTCLFITGSYELLNLLARILSNWKGKAWNEIRDNILLPRNIVSFNTQKTKILNKVQGLRTKILQLQEEIDQIVYRLYGLSKEEIKIIEGTVR